MTGELHNFNEQEMHETEEVQSLKFKLNRAYSNLILTVLIIAMLIGSMFLQNALANQTEKEAYLLSAIITEYESILFLKYHTTPNFIGLREYRDAWIDNPCYETTLAYYNKLSETVEQLENGTFPDNSYDVYLSKKILTV